MSYNIWYGFYTDNTLHTLDKKRLCAAKAIIKREDPDVLVLNEAISGPAHYGFKEYVAEFGFSTGYFAAYTDWFFGNAILSKQAMHAKTVDTGHRNMIRASIKGLEVNVFHPHPVITDEQRAIIIAPVLKSAKKPFVLVGDYNAISDEDTYDKEKLLKAWQSLDGKKKGRNVVENLTNARFIPFLREQGLQDAFEGFKKVPTHPTPAVRKNFVANVRIDHCFTSADVKVRDARIITSQRAKIASDHYPIVCNLEFKKK